MTSIGEIIFWGAIFIVFYVYLGYGAVITLLARVVKNPVRKAPIYPPVSLIISAYNEERVIRSKIENSLALSYPRDRLEIIVISDGSTDSTPQIVSEYAAQGVIPLYQRERRGKPAAMCRAVPFASGEIVLFSDANSMYNRAVIEKLVRNFADPQVGCVTGGKRIRVAENSAVSKETGLYWRYESFLKERESRMNSIVGANGEIYAVRKDLFSLPETDSLVEDFLLSMRIAAAGYRVVYEPEAFSLEDATLSFSEEFERKVRIAAGGFQSILWLKALLNPKHGLLSFQYISHRVLRWAMVPFLLPVILMLNIMLLPAPFYAALFSLQVAFYALAMSGWFLQRKGLGRNILFYVPYFFCMMNAAALFGFYRFASGKQQVTWKKARRGLEEHVHP